MNKVLLTGRLTRDPEMRSLASGKAVTQFGVATNEYRTNGQEKSEFHNVVTWDRLAEICGQYLGKGQQVAVEGRLQTRSWDDEQAFDTGRPRSSRARWRCCRGVGRRTTKPSRPRTHSWPRHPCSERNPPRDPGGGPGHRRRRGSSLKRPAHISIPAAGVTSSRSPPDPDRASADGRGQSSKKEIARITYTIVSRAPRASSTRRRTRSAR
jgi:single-stranded DNA-binding protein